MIAADTVAASPPEALSISAEGSQAFARLSGDFNPQHLDPVAARRTLYGSTVVHGVHAALHALDRGLRDVPGEWAIRGIGVQFYLPIATGASFQASLTPLEGDRWRCKVTDRDRLAVVVDLHLAAPADAQAPPVDAAFAPCPPEEPAVIAAGVTGTTPLQASAALGQRLLPTLFARFEARQLAIVLSTTRIVGMRMPGPHSIFKSFRLDFTAPDIDDAPDEIGFAVRRFAADLSFCSLAVSGRGFRGTVDAVVRPPPVAQATFAAASAVVERARFAGRRVIVVGGSRGLGEVAAKLAAAGGADVLTTYRAGEADAHAVVDDIRAGGGRAATLRFDASASGGDALGLLAAFAPTHLCYFATPRIAFHQGPFDQAQFAAFHAAYVTHPATLIDALVAGRVPGDLLTVLSPSTVYVDTVQPGAAEYAAAKAAAEVFCRYRAARDPGVLRILTPRLPRVATDQTVAPIKETMGSALDVLTPIMTDLLA